MKQTDLSTPEYYKIKWSGSIAMRIKNTPEGLQLIADLKKAARAAGKVDFKVRGRCSDRVAAFKITGRPYYSYKANGNDFTPSSPEAPFADYWGFYIYPRKNKNAVIEALHLERFVKVPYTQD